MGGFGEEKKGRRSWWAALANGTRIEKQVISSKNFVIGLCSNNNKKIKK